jgi:predicted nucleotidyltransferase
VNKKTHTVLPELFKSEERIRILRHIGIRTSFTVQSVTDATGVSKGLVSQYLNMLVQENLLDRKKRTFIRSDTALWKAAKRLLNLDLLRLHILLPAWAEGIGIYGSWAEGTNTIESDLDLWLLVKDYGPEVEISTAELEQNIAAAIRCEVHALILTGEKLHRIREHDQPFYAGLMKGCLTLEGKDLDGA